jgi:SlyX protein
MPADSTDARLAEIEIKLSFSENLLDELNRTVYRQQRQIDELQQALRELRRQVEANAPSEPGEARDPRDEVPPHY